MPLNYEQLLSREYTRRPTPAIRGLLAHESRPGMISFLAGKPNPNGFPFQSISVTLKPDSIMSKNSETDDATELVIEGEDLERALQYGSSSSDKMFSDCMDTIVSTVHGRKRGDGSPAGDYELAVGTGSQDLLAKVRFFLLCYVILSLPADTVMQTSLALFDEGDTVLVESPMYPGLLPDLASRGIHTVNIATDEEGLSDSALASVLENWTSHEQTSKMRFPKAIYTVPTGSNPAGTTASADRKRKILALARRHQVLIMEDDPYYYIGFDGLGKDPVTRERIPSYFALEREQADEYGYGYVLRFESFSKIMSAGMRLGYVVGPKPIVTAIVAYTATSSIHASSPIQVIVAHLLRHWGVNGFLQHVDKVASMYRERRDVFASSLEKILGSGPTPVATWTTPVSGMFFWLKLHLPPTPEAPEGDSFQVIAEKALDEGVLVVPGSSFYAGGCKTPYARVSFSVIPENDIAEGLHRLRRAIESAWKDAGYSTIPPM